MILWVDPDSSELAGKNDRDRDRAITDLLGDACVLLGMRWGVEYTVSDIGGTHYAFAIITRFTVSNQGIERALGDLSSHVRFLRGNPAHTMYDLIRYKECKEKWKVPDPSTESYTGPEGMERPGTSSGTKRPRF